MVMVSKGKLAVRRKDGFSAKSKTPRTDEAKPLGKSNRGTEAKIHPTKQKKLG